MEKCGSVSQKAMERFERVRSYLEAHRALFAAQGSVVATWRHYRGRRLGPYFQVSWREEGRQRWLYLGRFETLAEGVRELLGRLQGPHRRRRRSARLQRQVRASLRVWKAKLKRLLAPWGIHLKGFEFRGVRRALPRYVEALGPHRLARPPDPDGSRTGFQPVAAPHGQDACATAAVHG